MTNRISTPTKTKEIIEKYNFSFKKNFGQNFLIDTNILDNIAKAAEISKDDFIIEIGPGIGSLTQVMAEYAGKVLAFEIDKTLLPILSETLGDYDNIEIINQDILKADINDVIKNKACGMKVKIVANLPYYITTPIIMELLEKRFDIESITVMVQKEVAQRMQAEAGSSDYGALTLAVNYYCDIQIDMIVPPSCFMPRPKVASAVITLKVLDKPKVSVRSEELFFRVIKCAFGQRRKTLMNSLFNQGGFNIPKEDFAEIIKQCGLDEKVRGEVLTIEQFALLSDKIYDFKK